MSISRAFNNGTGSRQFTKVKVDPRFLKYFFRKIYFYKINESILRSFLMYICTKELYECIRSFRIDGHNLPGSNGYVKQNIMDNLLMVYGIAYIGREIN